MPLASKWFEYHGSDEPEPSPALLNAIVRQLNFPTNTLDGQQIDAAFRGDEQKIARFYTAKENPDNPILVELDLLYEVALRIAGFNFKAGSTEAFDRIDLAQLYLTFGIAADANAAEIMVSKLITDTENIIYVTTGISKSVRSVKLSDNEGDPLPDPLPPYPAYVESKRLRELLTIIRQKITWPANRLTRKQVADFFNGDYQDIENFYTAEGNLDYFSDNPLGVEIALARTVAMRISGFEYDNDGMKLAERATLIQLYQMHGIARNLPDAERQVDALVAAIEDVVCKTTGMPKPTRPNRGEEGSPSLLHTP
jgi:hypothetical protein